MPKEMFCTLLLGTLFLIALPGTCVPNPEPYVLLHTWGNEIDVFHGPEGIGVSQQALYVDIPIVLAVSVACVLVLATGRTITRWEGAVLLGGYVLYIGWRVWMAT